jgi:Holliday junction resolvasome RuvABC ATP-dependent DNA helicase subunit
MLHGLTGVGKTTLAKIIANHCGYQAKEVNASSLQNGESLIEVVRNSLSTNAYFGKSGFQ